MRSGRNVSSALWLQKEVVLKVSWLDRISHRSVTKGGTVGYLTDGTRNKENGPTKGYMRPTEKWKEKQNIRERLQVEDLPIPSGLVDTIPDFFTLVRGRPVKEKFNKREFIAGCRYRFIQNLEQGFMCDIIKQDEDQTKIQTTVLEDAVQESRDMKKLMDLFLADQQKEAVALEENFKKIKNDRETIEAEHKEVSKKMGIIKDAIHRKSDEIDNALQYKNFLLEISSRTWLEEYAKEKEIWSEENKNNVDNFIIKVAEYLNYGESDSSMEEVLKKFITQYENCGPTKIQFKDVQEVINLLKAMYLGNLEKATMIRDLKLQAGPLVQARRKVERRLFKHRKQLEKDLQKAIKEGHEKKATQDRLRSIYKDVKKMCKDLIVSKEVLKNLALLKDFYEEVTGNNSDFMSEEDMWREIDEVYTNLKEMLQEIPEIELKHKYKAIKKKQEDEMKKAVKAKNRLIQVESMISGIKKSYEKPITLAKKPVLPRSVPPPETPPSSTPPSTPGASYHEELEIEKNLYYPLKHLKDMHKVEMKLSQGTVDKEDRYKIVDDKICRLMTEAPVSILESSSETSSVSSEDLTAFDPTLKMATINPAKEFVNKELGALKDLPTFEKFTPQSVAEQLE
ncbi:uncharacterized protein isoform X2 [Rhodnius prolixus]|uniref:uncharacterized protein isoform X2 n=1 Tax=Rhodnius prolixus TaxID=13249 RepID=UPI003D18FBCE